MIRLIAQTHMTLLMRMKELCVRKVYPTQYAHLGVSIRCDAIKTGGWKHSSTRVTLHANHGVAQPLAVLIQPVPELGDPVSLRSPAALIHHLPVLDDVESVEIRSVRAVARVLHAVCDYSDARRLPRHQPRRAQPLLQTPVLADLIRSVRTDPAVGGMRLLDVDHQRVGDVRVLEHEPLERLETRHERRSAAASEIEHQRPLSASEVQHASARRIRERDHFAVGRVAAETRGLHPVQLVSVENRFERLPAEHAAVVGDAQRRVFLLLLLLLFAPQMQQNSFPHAQKIKTPQYERGDEKTRQDHQTRQRVFQRLRRNHDRSQKSFWRSAAQLPFYMMNEC